ncbi:hypothetical protein AL035_05565 [Salipiger aestuarii]|uniref:Secreted protein n=1 Tax=Salipiger aestuarii TaxID=568098 RepID=A0A327YH60_9RHOB|nr:PEP_CTERM-anchored TLD domain-containing protein [Salipiger aestuarii]KAB2542817.1 hypothetical protein AL035_05565 [Salipiger aestuarii]RAK20233.1 hypothetical protein ATI53_100610 [Salipiger aestuarii]
MVWAQYAAVLVLALSGTAQAVTVSPVAQLLDPAGSAQLQDWIGLGDQGFTRIWQGEAGVATAAGFHAAVDGAGPTVSIFRITLHDGSASLIGGHSTIDWGTASGFHADPDAFVFNLTATEIQRPHSGVTGAQAIYVDPAYFPTFGGGHDLIGGIGTLGVAVRGSNVQQDGYSYAYSYDPGQGQIALVGDSGSGWGNSGYGYDAWSVDALEVYSYMPRITDPTPDATPVPLPAALPLLAGAVLAAAALRRPG